MASKRGPASTYKSHKAFQPIHPCGNKLLQLKWDQTYYDQHQKLVKAAKPMVDSKPPPSRPHVTAKLKKQQLERERLEIIDRDNMTLLKKMQHIMKTEGCVDHRNSYHGQHHSLNQQQRQREVERVAHENKRMLKRLEQVEPIYKVSVWVDEWQRKEALTGMISCYPEAQSRSDTPIMASSLAKNIRDKMSSPVATEKAESDSTSEEIKVTELASARES